MTTSTAQYLRKIGVAEVPPAICPFDPGYDPVTLDSHLEQSSHLCSALKISLAGWMIADETATRKKLASARARRVPTVTGGGPFEVAVAQGQLSAYLDLCADIGLDRIECGEGFTESGLEPVSVAGQAHRRGLGIEFELGKKHGGPFTADSLEDSIAEGRRWLDAGALLLVVEARESARGVGLFDASGQFNRAFADRLVEAFGLQALKFEAPTKESQFAIIDHFGREVHLSNVRLEEILRVEIYRRGLHSDAFAKGNLRPIKPGSGADGSVTGSPLSHA